MTARRWMLAVGLALAVALQFVDGDAGDAALPAIVAPVERPAGARGALPALPGGEPPRAIGEAPRAIGPAPRGVSESPPPAATPTRATDLKLLASVDGDAPFREHSWFVAPPPPKPAPAPALAATPAPPPAPIAPPIPWVFSGRMESEDGTVVYLSAGERLLAVRAGATLDRSWRLESIDAAAIHFRYLPLNSTHSLPAGR